MRQVILLASALVLGAAGFSPASAKGKGGVLTFGLYEGSCAVENCGGLTHKGQAIVTLETGRGNGAYYYTYLVSCTVD